MLLVRMVLILLNFFAKGYEVHGIKRRSSLFNTQRRSHLPGPHVENSRFKLHYGDLSDTSNLTRILRDITYDEVYNLGAQSHVAVSLKAQSILLTLMQLERCDS